MWVTRQRGDSCYRWLRCLWSSELFTSFQNQHFFLFVGSSGHPFIHVSIQISYCCVVVYKLTDFIMSSQTEPHGFAVAQAYCWSRRAWPNQQIHLPPSSEDKAPDGCHSVPGLFSLHLCWPLLLCFHKGQLQSWLYVVGKSLIQVSKWDLFIWRWYSILLLRFKVRHYSTQQYIGHCIWTIDFTYFCFSPQYIIKSITIQNDTFLKFLSALI